jgi:hypothetical protein
MRILFAAAALAALAAASCGGEGDATGNQAADLKVVVRPDGPAGAARRATIACDRLGPGSPGSPVCDELGGLSRRDLAPVPRDVACAEVYGGPAVASVRGTLHGKRVSARFSLSDACEVRRWGRNSALLGEPPLRRG